MWPVISSTTNDDIKKEKWIKNDPLISWWEIQKKDVNTDTNLPKDNFSKKHLWEYNIRLKHILASLIDWIPFWEYKDKGDLYANMIIYNTEIRKAVENAGNTADAYQELDKTWT